MPCDQCGKPIPHNGNAPFDNEDRGVAFLHCALCLAHVPNGESAASYARLQVAWTLHGIQVWCLRHHANVLHVDFEGHKHPAITSRKKA